MLTDLVVNEDVLLKFFPTGDDAIIVLINSAMLLLSLLHSFDEITDFML